MDSTPHVSQPRALTRVALVGAGYIAREHLACLTQLKNAEVVAVCDRSAVMAEVTCQSLPL